MVRFCDDLYFPESVLVEISVTKPQYLAVSDVRAGSTVLDVAARFGISRQAVHRWQLLAEVARTTTKTTARFKARKLEPPRSRRPVTGQDYRT
jgi:transposase